MDYTMNKIIHLSIIFIVWLFVSFPAWAGNFQVSPITLELGSGVNSGVFTVMNEGQEKINFQIAVSEWTQDSTGKDVYSETGDIVFFPKIMTLLSGEQRVIRVGLKGPRGRNEKTYRIFIEEIPSREKSAGVNLAFSIRFAPPIFVKPTEIITSGAIDTIQLAKGELSAMLRNTGNVHLKIASIWIKGRSASGAEIFSHEMAGWYLLHHVARNIEASFPQEKCKELSSVEIEAKMENSNLNGKLDVQRGMCNP
jgi:fimbrial chaperone protein